MEPLLEWGLTLLQHSARCSACIHCFPWCVTETIGGGIGKTYRYASSGCGDRIDCFLGFARRSRLRCEEQARKALLNSHARLRWACTFCSAGMRMPCITTTVSTGKSTSSMMSVIMQQDEAGLVRLLQDGRSRQEEHEQDGSLPLDTSLRTVDWFGTTSKSLGVFRHGRGTPLHAAIELEWAAGVQAILQFLATENRDGEDCGADHATTNYARSSSTSSKVPDAPQRPESGSDHHVRATVSSEDEIAGVLSVSLDQRRPLLHALAARDGEGRTPVQLALARAGETENSTEISYLINLYAVSQQLALETNIEKCRAIVERVGEKLLCKLCYAREINAALGNCGHAFCGKCVRELQSGAGATGAGWCSRCPECRQPFTDSQVVELFLS